MSLNRQVPLNGSSLWCAGFALGLANFIVVLDSTIANVSVPTIAGALGSSVNQGTWTITSYAVAEAISIPMTSWLVARFGLVRMFVACVSAFGVCSALSGLSPSLESLIVCRVLQGLCGGPLLALSQLLLIRIFPVHLKPVADTLWAVTLLVGPILGPVLGGIICESLGWSFIFYLNVPIVAICSVLAFFLLRGQETPTTRTRIDSVSLLLLIIWVGSLQMLLDLGKDEGWFGSGLIVGLATTATVTFVIFSIWDLTSSTPLVGLSVFRRRDFFVSVVTTCMGFGTFFGISVVTPLWLQQNMAYTATSAGQATACSGALAVLAAPMASFLASRLDARALVCGGLLWLAALSLWRATGNTDITFTQIAIPMLLQGIGISFFLLPINVIALDRVPSGDLSRAASLLSFYRTLSSAAGTSIFATLWENRQRVANSSLVDNIRNADTTLTTLTDSGFSHAQAVGILQSTIDSQTAVVALNDIYIGAAAMFVTAAGIVWLASRGPPVQQKVASSSDPERA